MNAFVQRTEVSQTGSAFAAPTGWNWNYDSLGQVTTAEHATTPANHRAYAYDAIGNRLQGSAGVPPASTTTAYTSNNLNRYAAVATVSPLHDADGNMTSGQLPTGSAGLVWDAENRFTTVSISGGDTVHHTYDSQSRRIARTVGTDTTLFVYDQWNVIAEYEESACVPPALSKTHLWGADLSGSEQGADGVGGLLSVTDHTGSTPVTHFPTYDVQRKCFRISRRYPTKSGICNEDNLGNEKNINPASRSCTYFYKNWFGQNQTAYPQSGIQFGIQKRKCVCHNNTFQWEDAGFETRTPCQEGSPADSPPGLADGKFPPLPTPSPPSNFGPPYVPHSPPPGFPWPF